MRITKRIQEKIKELAPDHTRKEIAEKLNLKYKTLTDFITKNDIVCVNGCQRRFEKKVITPQNISPYVLPGLKINPLLGVVRGEKRIASLKMIKNVVLNYFELSEETIQSKSRTEDIVWPRQIIYSLAYSMTGLSQKIIAREVGNRDRTTLVNGLRIVSNRTKTDLRKAREYREIKGIIDNLMS